MLRLSSTAEIWYKMRKFFSSSSFNHRLCSLLFLLTCWWMRHENLETRRTHIPFIRPGEEEDDNRVLEIHKHISVVEEPRRRFEERQHVPANFCLSFVSFVPPSHNHTEDEELVSHKVSATLERSSRKFTYKVFTTRTWSTLPSQGKSSWLLSSGYQLQLLISQRNFQVPSDSSYIPRARERCSQLSISTQHQQTAFCRVKNFLKYFTLANICHQRRKKVCSLGAEMKKNVQCGWMNASQIVYALWAMGRDELWALLLAAVR